MCKLGLRVPLPALEATRVLPGGGPTGGGNTAWCINGAMP